MQTPVNPFKEALHQGRVQIGLWVGHPIRLPPR